MSSANGHSEKSVAAAAAASSLSKPGFKFKTSDFISHRQHTSSTLDSSKHSSNLLASQKEDQDDQDFFDSKYETLHYLGKGRHSKVFCCKDRESGAIRAVKIWRKSRRMKRKSLETRPLLDFEDIDLDGSNKATKDDGPAYNPELREFYLMQELSNPNIAAIYELLEGPTHYYMVLEYSAGGTLKDDLKQQPGERYAEDKAGLFLHVLFRTIAYLHRGKMEDTSDKGGDTLKQSRHSNTKTIIHCDLNLSNIILDETKEKAGLLKLVDFGDALAYDEEAHAIPKPSLLMDDDDQVDWYEPRGAQLPFMAPEMFAYDKTIDKASDVWSLGVIAYILLSGKYPFGHAGMTSTLELQQSIEERLGFGGGDESSNHLFDHDLAWVECSDQAKDFITSLLQLDPDDRPSAEEALQHEWMEHIRQRFLADTLAGGGSHHHRHMVEHGKQVWGGLKETARRRKSSPKVLKQAALTLIASQLVLKDEKKYIDEVFQMMDVKADGVLSKDEVRQGYQEIFGRELKDRDLDVLFEKVDLGGTGTIEYSEFVIAAMNEKQLLHTEKLQKAFAAFDTDKTGFISAANLKPLLQSYLQEHDESEHVEILESIISQVDRDGDGLISFEEFMAMMLHSSNGKRRRARSPKRIESTASAASTATVASLTTSMLMSEPPSVFASTTSSLSSGKRRSLWESSVQLTFRPEQIIGRRAEQLIDHYEIGEYIQSGAFGSVWFCKHKESGATRAVKYVKKSKHKKENELILREFNILKALDHPNILKMFELFEDDKHFEIVMDACKGGDLCDEIDNFGAIDEVGACLILQQVLGCVNYCHQRHIVHCDLKPDNILMEENKAINQLKIIDFGLAANMVGEEERKEGSVKDGRIREKRGTLRFMAPEVLASNYGPKCDVWACGVMAYLLLSDKFPFDGQNRAEVIERINRGSPSYADPIWATISKEAKSFIKSCLTVDEDLRPSAEEALQHPWIRTARDAVDHNFHRKEVCEAAEALDNLKQFQARSVLAQAAYTFIASQLLLKEEKAKIDEVFRVMDISCDGKLSKQELKAGYKKIFGYDISDEEVDVLFERVDLDGTGYIEYSEFVVASLGQKDVVKNDNLKKAFSAFDTRNRGYISKAELKRGLSTFLGDNDAVDDHMLRKIMKQVDRDGDGKISYEEFLATMLNLAEVPQPEHKPLGRIFNDFLHLFDKRD